ncbi:MAG: HAD family phosphatase [Clostridia bacterium]|nr:HAD family phosphatase [Clostridia bacterium]
MRNLKDIKAIFLDVDGTLLNNKKQITDATKTIIKEIKNKGIYIILCSGRSNKDVCKYSQDAYVSEYTISSNGAQIYNYITKENCYKNCIKYNYIKAVWEYCNKNNLELVFNLDSNQTGNNIFCSNIYKDRTIIEDIESLKDIDIFQIIINSKNYYDIQHCEEYILSNKTLKIANYSREYIKKDPNSKEPYYIFINNKLVDKGIAIREILKEINIKKEETICFGDRINDITMFKACGITVAMKNADEELKKIADYITLSNEEDGVADFIKKYIL